MRIYHALKLNELSNGQQDYPPSRKNGKGNLKILFLRFPPHSHHCFRIENWSRFCPLAFRKVASKRFPLKSRINEPSSFIDVTMTGCFNGPPLVCPALPETT